MGIGLGIQDSLLSVPIALMLPAKRRAYAIGLFSAVYGTAWFVGSSTLGLLYQESLLLLVIVSVVPQLLALPLLVPVTRSFGAGDASGMSEHDAGRGPDRWQGKPLHEAIVNPAHWIID